VRFTESTLVNEERGGGLTVLKEYRFEVFPQGVFLCNKTQPKRTILGVMEQELIPQEIVKN
jgi:hypothetical protein